ncbi:MAG: AGE family epimerase/isomerase [Candidatus Omnitrophica bacterium]|nr:AGE family epimerase/isomerase [Candidatus Omnitrophota bacterium]
MRKYHRGILAILLILLSSYCLLSFAMAATMPDYALNNADQLAKKFGTWLKNNRDPVLGVPYSHVGDPRFKHWAITYDSAVVAMAYLANGETPEAQKIIDAYINASEIWRLGGVVEAFVAEKPLKVIDWSVRSGANIWLANASLRCYQKTAEKRYLILARRIMDLMLILQEQRADSQNFGGVALGPAGDPQYPKDQHINYDLNKPQFKDVYSTEVTVDAYATFHLLAQITGEVKYSQAARRCLKWLANNAFNREEHRFNRGYNDKFVASDVQSFGISALGVEELDFLETGLAEKMASFIENNCLSSVTYNKPEAGGNMLVRGIDFVNKARLVELGRGPLVSFEWTFQLANSYLRLEKDFLQMGDKEKPIYYRQKRAELLSQIVEAASSRDGGLAYPYATMDDAVIGHEYRTPISSNFSAIGAAYAILALREYDPLVVESK